MKCATIPIGKGFYADGQAVLCGPIMPHPGGVWAVVGWTVIGL